MTQEELINIFKYIVKKCDMLINNNNYKADNYTQDIVEDIAELCNHILDGNYGKLVEVKEVDLEKLIDDYMLPITAQDVKEESFTQLEKCAKHFFELGLKVKQESNDEVKVGETQIYFNDSREQPYVGKGLDLSCMKYETLKTLFKDGDNVEILIRKA